MVSAYPNVSTPVPIIDIDDERKVFDFIFTGGKYKKRIQRAREAYLKGDDDGYERIKKYMIPSVTWGGTFFHRSVKGLKETSGLMYMDCDRPVKQELMKDPRIYAVWNSVSGKNVGFIVGLDGKPDARNYSETFRNVRETLEKDHPSLEIDSVSDICRLNILSHDPDIHVNPNAEPWEIVTDKNNIETPGHQMFNDGEPIKMGAHPYRIMGELVKITNHKGLVFQVGSRHNFTVSFAGKCNFYGMPYSDTLDFLGKNGMWFEETERIVTKVYGRYIEQFNSKMFIL